MTRARPENTVMAFTDIIIDVINGRSICRTLTRFGWIFIIENTGTGFTSLKAAEDFAINLPEGHCGFTAGGQSPVSRRRA